MHVNKNIANNRLKYTSITLIKFSFFSISLICFIALLKGHSNSKQLIELLKLTTFQNISKLRITSTKVHVYSNCEIYHVHLELQSLHMCVKALPRVCLGNTARGGVSRGKYSTRHSRVLYLPRDSPRVLYFLYMTS